MKHDTRIQFAAIKFQKDRSKPVNGNVMMRKGIKSYPQCSSANEPRHRTKARGAIGKPAFDVELPVLQVVIGVLWNDECCMSCLAIC